MSIIFFCIMSLNRRKIAVVLFNLGGPDRLSSVRPFLFNLFSDFFIIRLPYIFRILLAFLISITRNKEASKNYKIMGGNSPLLQETQNQKAALERKLEKDLPDMDFQIFTSMRYWHPFSYEVINEIKKFNPSEILCLPLYPHFSTTTTQSSFYDFSKFLKKKHFNVTTKFLCCYYSQDNFIDAHVQLIKNTIDNLQCDEGYILIFSAHSIPQKIVDTGDPYQWQIKKSVELITQKLQTQKVDIEHVISYQSKIGPVKWLEPSTEDIIKQYAQQKRNMILVPISFVSEHIEVIVELDIEYKKIADDHNVQFLRIPTLRINSYFIESLYHSVTTLLKADSEAITSFNRVKNCPLNFSSCIYGRFL